MLRTLLPVLLALNCTAIVAQPLSGYFVAGVGGRQGKLVTQAALGAEYLVGESPFSVGAELGVIAGHDSFVPVSFNGYYHPLTPPARCKLDPFVTAGYTEGLSIFGSAGHFLNTGAGLNYWFRRRAGVRMEFRALVKAGPVSINSFRAGIAFR